MIFLIVALGIALGYATGSWVGPIVLIVILAAALAILDLARPHGGGTPVVIRRVPTLYEQDRRPRSRWLYGLFLHIPILPFLSVGLFRWRGRK